MQKQSDTLILFEYFKDSTVRADYTELYNDTIPFVRFISKIPGIPYSTTIYAFDTITLNINGKNIYFLKFMYDAPNMIDEEAIFYMHDRYGLIFLYSIAWGNVQFVSNSSNRELNLISSKLRDEINKDKELYFNYMNNNMP